MRRGKDIGDDAGEFRLGGATATGHSTVARRATASSDLRKGNGEEETSREDDMVHTGVKLSMTGKNNVEY